MKKSITTCLWFDGQAQEAATFYCGIFPESTITSQSPMVVNWQVKGYEFMGLNGGPQYKANPSISFFVSCETNEEVDAIWQKLSEGAMVMMALDKYPWSEYYGFLQDKFGISWQIYKGNKEDASQYISPCLLFTDNLFGRAYECIQFYTNLFRDSAVEDVSFYDKEEMPHEHVVRHGLFTLNGSLFRAMDGTGEHNFTFNEAISFVLSCDNQEEIDKYWDALTSDGGAEGMCGWCKDKFGVSWQVVPSNLGALMNHPEKGQKVMEAFLKMKKFDIATLLSV